MKKIRCAIYTRKSAEEGLEQEFNSLDAQREACAAYVASQKAEGWVLLPTVYEDAGISGGTLERPGLQRLLADIDAGLVEQIVVYKVDRLTRSLSDFAKLVERLDAASTGFVSVTQSFNTATSMGRLTLHMLLSFAQFEREVTAERIRDKVAASKRKGLWMGGRVPLGYEKDERTLRINEAETETVRTLYALYRKHGTLRQVKAEADRLRLRTKRRFAADGTRTGGLPFRRGHLHCLLTNPLYAGRIRHQRRVYEGQHPSIIAPELWDTVQAQLQAGATKPRRRTTKGRAARPVPKLGPFEIDRKSEPFDVYNDVGSPHPFAAKRPILAALNCGINDGSSFFGAQASCCRRATFSRASSRRTLKAETRARTNDEIMQAWCRQTGD